MRDDVLGGARQLRVLAVTAAALSLAWQEPTRGESLTILHTNDLVGRLRPGAYFDETRGGMARLVRLLRELDADGNALIVDAGNALGPDPIAHMDGGRFFASLMDSAGYAAMMPGNHGLNYGPDTLEARAGGAEFAILGANVLRSDGGQPLLASYRIVERGDWRILVTGVVSQGVARVLNPRRIAGMRLGDPGAALAAVLDAAGDSADVIVALAHMPMTEVVDLARTHERVDLFIAGGHDPSSVKGGSTHLVELVNGVRIASTPGEGAAVGRLILDLNRDGDGEAQVRHAGADLIALTADLPEDREISRLIADREWLFELAGQREIADLMGTVPDSRQFMAELMRRALGAEVGFINHGAIRPIRLAGKVRQAHIDTLVRFDDILVRVALSGGELKRLAGESAARTKAGQKLVFSGYDPATHAISGVPVEAGERYSAVTTGYLASGGDGFLPSASYDAGVPHPELSLEHIALGFLSSQVNPMARLAAKRAAYRSWKVSARMTGGLTLTELNGRAGEYPVPAMGGTDALAWNTSASARAVRTAAASTVTADLRSSYGRLSQDGQSRESADRINAEVVYTRREPKPSPFAGVNLTTVWSVPGAESRPLTVRGSAGLAAQTGKHVTTRFGLGLERDFRDGTSQVGLEVNPEARLPLSRGNVLNSRAKLFVGATETRKMSLESYNSLQVSLWGDLKATVDVNLFAHWDNQVEKMGVKSEVQIGIGYTWDGRWARQ